MTGTHKQEQSVLSSPGLATLNQFRLPPQRQPLTVPRRAAVPLGGAQRRCCGLITLDREPRGEGTRPTRRPLWTPLRRGLRPCDGRRGTLAVATRYRSRCDLIRGWPPALPSPPPRPSAIFCGTPMWSSPPPIASRAIPRTLFCGHERGGGPVACHCSRSHAPMPGTSRSTQQRESPPTRLPAGRGRPLPFPDARLR